MGQVLLIRHGQSANNAAPEHVRVSDPELTEVGRRQAQATADHLRAVPIDYLYCSPFLRSLETTRPIALAKKMQAHIHAEIFEQGGCYSGHVPGQERGEPGLGRAHLVEAYPGWQIHEAIEDRGWWGRDYETLEQATGRAGRVARWLSEELAHRPGTYVLVIHADFKRLLIEAFLGEDPNKRLQGTPLYNVGITTFHWRQRWHLQELNSVDHLPAELVT